MRKFVVVKRDARACASYNAELSSRNIRTEKLQFASGRISEGPGASRRRLNHVFMLWSEDLHCNVVDASHQMYIVNKLSSIALFM
ncbi:hypothetical protein Trydic_g11179 [Trypoxylus dichotomus]